MQTRAGCLIASFGPDALALVGSFSSGLRAVYWRGSHVPDFILRRLAQRWGLGVFDTFR